MWTFGFLPERLQVASSEQIIDRQTSDIERLRMNVPAGKKSIE
jgi:hypothetical protein